MKLVDSSAWVEFLRRKGDSKIKHIVARLLEVDQAAYTCPIQFELLSGVRPGEMIWNKALLSAIISFGPEDCPCRDAAQKVAGERLKVEQI